MGMQSDHGPASLGALAGVVAGVDWPAKAVKAALCPTGPNAAIRDRAALDIRRVDTVRFALAFAVLVVVAGATDALAQMNWGFEVRSGAAFATQDLGEADLSTGFGFEGSAEYRFLAHLAGYAGWDWFQFGADESFAGFNVDVVETGYAFGLRFEHPFRGGKAPYLRLRAGGTYNDIEIQGGGVSVADSGHGLGWEAGTGLVFAVGSGWRLAPDVRYRSQSRDITVGGVDRKVDLSYLTLELAVSRR